MDGGIMYARKICGFRRGDRQVGKIMVLLIASSKGGVGKSTTALGMALSLARNSRVLLIDTDVASRSLDIFCGASPTFHLGDVLCGRCAPERAVCAPFPDVAPLLHLCPAPLSGDETDIPGGFVAAIPRALQAMSGGYDTVILDTGSGSTVAAALSPLCDAAFVCSEQSPASIRAAAYSAEMLANIPMVRLVVCNFDMRGVRRGERVGMLEMIDQCRLRCIGVVPNDPRLVRAQEMGIAPPAKCPAMQSYANIASRLSGYSVPLFYGIRRMRRRDAL